MRIDTSNTRSLTLRGDSSTTSMKAAVVQGARGEQGLPGNASAAWTASTAVTTGTVRQAPDGSWIKSTASRTTRASFDATEQGWWTATLATAGTLEASALSATITGTGDTRYAKVSSANTLAATAIATLRTQGGSTLDDGAGNLATSGRVQIGTAGTWGNNPTLRQVQGRSSGRVSIQSDQAATGTGGMELQLIPDTNVNSATTPTTQILLFNKNGFNYERCIQGFTTNIYTFESSAAGSGTPRNIVFAIGAYAEMNNVPGTNSIQIRNDGSVDLLAAQYNVTTGVIPAATTVSAFTSSTQITLSAAPVALAGWPAGTTYVTDVAVGSPARVVRGCTLTAGSTTVTTTGAFVSGDVGTAITSRVTYGTNQTRFVDPANTGRSTPIIDTRTGSPSSSTADRAYMQYRRGGVTKWLAGLNPSGGDIDAFEVQDLSGNVGIRVAQGGAVSFPSGVTGVSTIPASMQNNDLLGWTFDLGVASLNSLILPNTAKVFLARIPVPVAVSVTNINLVLATLGNTLTNAYVALYDSSGTKIGQSADQSTAWGSAGATGTLTIPLAGGPFTVTPTSSNDFVWAAIYVGTATTAPTFGRGANYASAAELNIGCTASRSRYGSVSVANTASLPAVTPSGVTQTGAAYWLALS